MEDKFVNIDFDWIVGETEMAILFLADDEELWIPRSVIKDVWEKDQVVEIETWFAEKKGWI